MTQQEIDQQASNYAGNRELGAGHGHPSYSANMLEKGWKAGYQRAVEEYKEDAELWRRHQEIVNNRRSLRDM